MAEENLNDPKKTGYEDSFESDTFGEVGEEIAAPGETEEKIKPDEKIIEDENLSEEEKLKLAADFKAEQETEAKKLSDDIEDELPDGEKEKDEEDEKKVEKKEGEEEEKEVDIFDTTKEEEALEDETIVKKSSEKVEWAKVAKSIKLSDDLSLDLGEDNTLDGFKAAVKKTIEDAKQKVEFKMDGFDDGQKEVVNYFLNGGKKADLLTPLKQVDDLILEDGETKVKNFYVHSEGLTEDAAQEKINDLLEEDKFDDMVKTINGKLLDIRETQFNKIIEDNNTTKEDSVKLKQKEYKEMETYVDDVKTFMGIKLPEKVKSLLKKEINTGKLTNMNDSAEAQVLARLYMLYGTKIIKQINEGAKNESRDSYNKGQKTVKEKIHNLPPKVKSQEAIEQKKDSGLVDPLALFADMDSDAIDME
jgi:disulfide oxidoreductase YuzD